MFKNTNHNNKKYEKFMQLEEKLMIEEMKVNQAEEELLNRKSNLEIQSQKIGEIQKELDEVKIGNRKKALRGFIVVSVFSIIGILVNLGVYCGYNKKFENQIQEHKAELEEKEAALEEQMKSL